MEPPSTLDMSGIDLVEDTPLKAGGAGARGERAGHMFDGENTSAGSRDRVLDLERRLSKVEGWLQDGGSHAVLAQLMDARAGPGGLQTGGTGSQEVGEGGAGVLSWEEGGAAGRGGLAGGLMAFAQQYTAMKEASGKMRDLEALIVKSFKLAPLERVDLSHCGLGRLPHSLCRAMSHIRILKLDHGVLSSLPGATRHLALLEELHVTHNRLAYLPVTLWALSRLRTLTLAHNRHVCQRACWPASMHVCQPVCLSVCLFVRPSVCLSVYLFIYVSVSTSRIHLHTRHALRATGSSGFPQQRGTLAHSLPSICRTTSCSLCRLSSPSSWGLPGH